MFLNLSNSEKYIVNCILADESEFDKQGIYKITSPSGSIYVGMTTDSFRRRWQGPLKELRNGKHPCRGLKRAFKKYREENLIFSILEISLERIIAMRKFEKKQFSEPSLNGGRKNKKNYVNIYNGCPTGTGSVIHTEETRENLKKSMERYRNTEKYRNKIYNRFVVC